MKTNYNPWQPTFKEEQILIENNLKSMKDIIDYIEQAKFRSWLYKVETKNIPNRRYTE